MFSKWMFNNTSFARHNYILHELTQKLIVDPWFTFVWNKWDIIKQLKSKTIKLLPKRKSCKLYVSNFIQPFFLKFIQRYDTWFQPPCYSTYYRLVAKEESAIKYEPPLHIVNILFDAAEGSVNIQDSCVYWMR